MNAQQALWYVQSFFETHPESRPAPQFRIGTAQQVSVTGEPFFLVGVVDETGQPVIGSSTYYVFADGTTMVSPLDPNNPENVEAMWLRWKSQKLI